MFARGSQSLTVLTVFLFATYVVLSRPTTSAPSAVATPLCPIQNVTCCRSVGNVGEELVDEALAKAGLIPDPTDNLVGYNICTNQTVLVCPFNVLCCKDNSHAGIVALTCGVIRGPQTPVPA
ncbi:hypothetical protein BD410DRAFT_426810 [Rickenella mellea]|uniref:Hydrophobin n=1 Tax=Rickenella mellea TaxID=50990 RepID=A0A4Y7QJH6_9AGAM|nr:hypothetical protein BD410DRAFT_426810 [Rickenella mellea]